MRPNRCVSIRKQQQGVAVLFVVVMMAFMMGLLALTASRSVIIEQRITGNDVRARESHQAAEAGLAFAKAWADSNVIDANLTCPGGAGCPTVPNVTGTTSGETYALAISFNVDTDGNVGISSTATNSDNGRATVEDWISQVSMLNDPFFPPPIVVNGGLSNVTGNPSINTGNPPDPAIVYNSNVVSESDISTGKFNKKGSDPTLGDIVGDAFPNTATPAWDYVFSVSLNAAIARAQANGYVSSAGSLPSAPGAGKGPFYVWDSSSHIHSSYGTASNPVVIVIPDECPKLNGGPVIYGIVYFGNPACGNAHGWGNATIHGSIVAEGDITKVTANADHIDLTNSTAEKPKVFLDYSTSIPGTWKDF